ncbi:ion channel [Agromyces sp. G08B096]|uniref:Ion channel n=1 Tax=Agromyces sp. G08B096 TaxID=3156399 RepID=A0AAU7W3B7_9MICO
MSARPLRPAPRRDAWERVTTVPLVVLGLAFIVAYSVWVLGDDPVWRAGTAVALVASWFVFVVDVVVRIALTPRGDRWRFAATHPVDVLSALLPVFRAFRVLALLRNIPYLQRRSGAAVRTRLVIYAASYAIVFVYFIALATLNAERDADGATIVTFGDAIWWAIVTIATVGYGDMYPITAAGRVYAVMLMAGGIAIVGTASATIISLLNERISSLRHHGAPDAPHEVHPAGLPAEAVSGEDEPAADPSEGRGSGG